MPDAYCVDASSFLKIFEDYSATHQEILTGLDVLVGSNRLFTVRVVVDEVTNNINRTNLSLETWLKLNFAKIVVPEDDQLLLATLQVVRAHSDLIDENSSRLQADPFLVGAARFRDLVVVTDELPRHLRRQRGRNILHIPDVCERLGIKWLSLAQMLRIESII